MTALAHIDNGQSLPSLVQRAASMLTGAIDSAEVLDACRTASAVYDATKSAARFARAKKAHDDVLSAIYRTQADALEIEALAKRRLADEYDAAQERGEVASQGKPVNVAASDVLPTVADLGLTRQDIHEARQIRDAEEADPGIIRRILDERLEAGQEPTKAAVRDAIVNRTSFTGNNEWFTPSEHIELARKVLGAIQLDPASSEIAQRTVKAKTFYTEADDGLSREWTGKVWLNPPYAQPAIGHFVDKMVDERAAGRVTEALMLTHNYTDTAWFQKAARAATAICFTRGRIRFVSPAGDVAAPTQGQAFFYFGDRVQTFIAHFRDVGFVVEVRQ